MARITLSVLEGLERGRVYEDLETPISIGREEDNLIQLNDERVSRIHAKLQEDRGDVILTDLNSTNGSRVNGHPVQLRVLQPGDHLQIGRCTLLFGSDVQIADYARRLGVEVASLTPSSQVIEGKSKVSADKDSDAEFHLADDFSLEHMQIPLFPGGAPMLPQHLSPTDRARVSDILAYMHEKLRDVSFDGEQEQDGENITVPWDRWQNMLQLHRDLATYLKKIANPHQD